METSKILTGIVAKMFPICYDQGGGRMWKRDQHSFFFSESCLTPLPPPTFLIEYVFPMLMFSEIFFYINNLLLSMALCGIRFTTRACPVKYEARIHSPCKWCETMSAIHQKFKTGENI